MPLSGTGTSKSHWASKGRSVTLIDWFGEKPNVRYWHKADMLNSLTNVRFGGKADIDQPLLTNLDL
jgi:hypothetical protein